MEKALAYTQSNSLATMQHQHCLMPHQMPFAPSKDEDGAKTIKPKLFRPWATHERSFSVQVPVATRAGHNEGVAEEEEGNCSFGVGRTAIQTSSGSDWGTCGAQRPRVRKQRPKRFPCPHCHVAFSNNGQLRGHVRIHTGERPFCCDHPGCGKTFTRNEELTRHKRIHSGVRPFTCAMCSKKFGRKDHLKKHLRTHQRPPQVPLPAFAIYPIYPFLW